MPHNLTELVAFLTATPWLTVTSTIPGVQLGRRTFLRFESGRIWTRDELGRQTFVPIGCRAHGDETGLTIDDRGFTIEKFGTRIRFDYAEEPTP